MTTVLTRFTKLWSIILTVAECKAVANGYGDHFVDLTHQQVLSSLKV
jgi:hypothetical protein